MRRVVCHFSAWERREALVRVWMLARAVREERASIVSYRCWIECVWEG